MISTDIRAQIAATKEDIERTNSIYRKRDLTKHLHRLQKQLKIFYATKRVGESE